MSSLRRHLSRSMSVVIVSFGLATALSGPMVAASAPPNGAETVDIDDVSTTRRVQLLTAALGAAGIALMGVTVWFWRNTRPDPDALAPLDVMSQRTWRRQETDERLQALATVRREAPMVAPSPVAVDLAKLAAERGLPSLDDHAGFGDLVEASVPSEGFGPLKGSGSKKFLGSKPGAGSFSKNEPGDLDEPGGFPDLPPLPPPALLATAVSEPLQPPPPAELR